MNEGKIVDASFVTFLANATKKRTPRPLKDTETIKRGGVLEGCKEKPQKLRQKDLDARWTKKNNETHYGYKNHAKCETKSKAVTKYKVTDASA